MKALLIASALILVTAGSVSAKQFPNVYYMALDMRTGKCVMMTAAPKSGAYKLMGTYKTPWAVNRAMRKANECHA